MPRTERILIMAALVTVGLGLLVALYRGIFAIEGGRLQALLWLMAASLVLVATLGTLWVGNLAAAGAGASVETVRLPVIRLPLEVIVPGLLALAAVAFVQIFVSGVLQGAVVLVAGVAYAAVLWAQAHARDTTDRYFALAQTALNVIAHLTAFLLFSVIYGLKIRSLASATAVGVIAILLLTELLWRDAAWHRAMGLPAESRRGTLGGLALVAGLIMSELTWGLNYWAALSTLVGGAFLLVVFYVVFGLASSYVDHRLGREVLVEYAVVGGIGIAAVFASAFFV